MKAQLSEEKEFEFRGHMRANLYIKDGRFFIEDDESGELIEVEFGDGDTIAKEFFFPSHDETTI